MIYFLVSFGLLAHLLFWGVGLAWWVSPRRWQKFWPLWIAPSGIALQSAVVWLGAHTTAAGTDAYAWWSELVPLGLLALGLSRQSFRREWSALKRFYLLGLVMMGCLFLLTLPLAYSSHELSTTSIGSCDAADYAAGARMFQEFSSADRTGFIGQSEVVTVGSTDNFFDFWLRLNHFTPSALIALNGSVLGLQPYQLTGLLTVVLVVLVLPLVFWTARTIGLGSAAALWLALLYGISPITWYAVAHVAPAQILAAMGITLVTLGAVMTWRDRARRRWASFGLLAVGAAIIWGGYNFIIVVGLVPAVACVGGWALARGEVKEFVRWWGRVLAPLALTGAFFYERVAGVAERFLLFQQTDFGWSIAPLWPEGWLGVVASTGLEPIDSQGGGVLSGTALGIFMIGAAQILRRNPSMGWRILAFVGPVLLGYGSLQLQGLHEGNHSSYDAYKLLAVFYPVVLVAFCPWLIWLRGGRWLRGLAVAMMLMITLGNAYATWLFGSRLSQGILVVEPTLPELQRIESLERVDSINLVIPNYWERLWANSFLLRKKQFMNEPTYEGRATTVLRGEWDLSGGIVQVKLPGGDSQQINDRFSLTRVGSPWFLRAQFGEGWHQPEMWRARKTRYWRWGTPVAVIVTNNPQPHPLRVVLHLEARGLTDREVQIRINRRLEQTITMGPDAQLITTEPMELAPGRSFLSLRVDGADRRQREEDQRLLGIAVYAITVEVLPDASRHSPL